MNCRGAIASGHLIHAHQRFASGSPSIHAGPSTSRLPRRHAIGRSSADANRTVCAVPLRRLHSTGIRTCPKAAWSRFRWTKFSALYEMCGRYSVTIVPPSAMMRSRMIAEPNGTKNSAKVDFLTSYRSKARSADRVVRDRFCVKRCGPSGHRLRDASAVPENFARHPKKTFSTLSAIGLNRSRGRALRAAPPSWGRHPQTFTISDIGTQNGIEGLPCASREA